MMKQFNPFHNRLIDAIENLLDLRQAYFDPAGFRRRLNASLQELRNVTFVLQKCGHDVEWFRGWYEEWRKVFAADPILKWLVEARNTVVKEGDLDAHSIAHVKIYTSWYDPPITSINIPPNIQPDDYAKRLSKVIPPQIKTEEALIYVERLWIHNGLPNAEIVDALGHCAESFIALSKSLSDKLQKSIPSELEIAIGKFRSNETHRTAWLKLKSDEIVESKIVESQISNVHRDIARERYGGDQEQLSGVALHTDFQNLCAVYFQMAMKILRVDGNHSPIAFLLLENGEVQPVGLQMDDRAGKHIAMRNLAEFVDKRRPTAVILINEAWVASFNGTAVHAAERKDRKEALTLIGVTRDGEVFCLWQPFDKFKGTVWFSGPPYANTSLPNLMRPVWDQIRSHKL